MVLQKVGRNKLQECSYPGIPSVQWCWLLVFLSGKTQALLEQRVLGGGGIEVKFKQEKKNTSIKNVILYLNAFVFQCSLKFCMFTWFLIYL